MRRLAIACALVAAAHGAVSAATLPDAWRHWRYARPVVLDAGDAARMVRVTVPAEALGKTRADLGDLRVIDDDGREIPFVLVARTGRTTQSWRTVALVDVGFVPGRYTEVTVDTGPDGAVHNAVELDTGRADFFAWVEVAAGDDRRSWRIVRDRAPVYRFERDRLAGTRTVTYPDARSRWLRLRILDPGEQLPVTGCRVAERIVEPAELRELPATFRREPGAAGRSRWRAELAGVPASQVRFETRRDPFHRPVSVETSDDGESWREVGHGEIYRYPTTTGDDGGDRPRSQLDVEFSEARGRHWRVVVHDRNDPPIEDLALTLRGTPRHVTFTAEPGTGYRLIYGNGRAAAPGYELARLTPREVAAGAPAAGLGAEAINDAWVSPEPWTERHPVVLWIALGFAVLVLGWLALRALR